MTKQRPKTSHTPDISPETQAFVTRVQALAKETVASKEASKAFMIRTGIYTEKGNLRKAYR